MQIYDFSPKNGLVALLDWDSRQLRYFWAYVERNIHLASGKIGRPYGQSKAIERGQDSTAGGDRFA